MKLCGMKEYMDTFKRDCKSWVDKCDGLTKEECKPYIILDEWCIEVEENDNYHQNQGYYIDNEEKMKCPKCGSKRISIIETFQIWHERNLNGTKIYSKSYSRTPFGRVFHSFKCRKCNWESVNFDE